MERREENIRPVRPDFLKAAHSARQPRVGE
jgi:hypothetical protein